MSAEELKQIITAVVTDWCTEIRRALDFFYTNYPDDPDQADHSERRRGQHRRVPAAAGLRILRAGGDPEPV
ncbi:MAG: hypothetical protein MZV70_40385 [Desulfobacterales bacterium]|nr:hypothetical protein [Desulfobacterales bacterium]